MFLFWYIINNVHDIKHLVPRSKKMLVESWRCHASQQWTRSGRSDYVPMRANEHRLSRLVLVLTLSNYLFTNSSSTNPLISINNCNTNALISRVISLNLCLPKTGSYFSEIGEITVTVTRLCLLSMWIVGAHQVHVGLQSFR